MWEVSKNSRYEQEQLPQYQKTTDLMIGYYEKIKCPSPYTKMSRAIEFYALEERLKTGRDAIRGRMKQALVFYIMTGFNAKTKKKIEKAMGISRENRQQIDKQLTDAGYLTKKKSQLERGFNDELTAIIAMAQQPSSAFTIVLENEGTWTIDNRTSE